jgi:hypothetical protein
MKAGSYVFIVRTEESFSRGQTKTRSIKIPGKIERFTATGKAEVVHYGPPNHFSRSMHEFGVYRAIIDLSNLEPRQPNIDDPKEFM